MELTCLLMVYVKAHVRFMVITQQFTCFHGYRLLYPQIFSVNISLVLFILPAGKMKRGKQERPEHLSCIDLSVILPLP